jgi:hypothetical protein
VQLYVRALDSKVEGAGRELKAFARVHVDAGGRRDVTLEIPVEELAYYDTGRGWVVEAGRYALVAARHAEDERALERVIGVA